MTLIRGELVSVFSVSKVDETRRDITSALKERIMSEETVNTINEEAVNIAPALHRIFNRNKAARLLVKNGTLMAFRIPESGVLGSIWHSTISSLYELAESTEGLRIREVPNSRGPGMVYFVNRQEDSDIECCFTQEQMQDLSFNKKEG
jgi:hypothetical protein